MSRKLPDDLSIAEYAELVSAISGLCDAAGWLMPTRKLVAANDMTIVGARYGSPFTVVVMVGVAAGAVAAVANAVKQAAAIGEVASRTKLNEVEADVRVREVEALERKTEKEADLLDAQVEVAKRQADREYYESVSARLKAEEQAMRNAQLRDDLFERRELAKQGVYRNAIVSSLREGGDPQIRARIDEHLYRAPQTAGDRGTTERLIDDAETLAIFDVDIELTESPEWPPADDSA